MLWNRTHRDQPGGPDGADSVLFRLADIDQPQRNMVFHHGFNFEGLNFQRNEIAH